MILGKEYLVQLEDLAAKQERIFPDAADVGLWVNSPSFRERVRALCQGLREIYLGKTRRWCCGSSWECFVPFEMEHGAYVGVTVRVSLNVTRKGKSFFSIDIFRDEQVESPFRPV